VQALISQEIDHMKDFPYRDMMHEHETAQKSRKSQTRERHFEEGSDVGGPRWRIGWGGLIHDNDDRGRSHDD
jgi:hypothetical protein